MKLTWFDELDSTSAEAGRCLQQESQPVPFAIGAGRQTAGRGQRSKSWQSPPGNLYVSLVLDVPRRELLSCLPLFTGLVIAEWLQDRFALTATLKWPNDILVNARKLGGILCECPIQGQQIGPAIIGIGLNVHTVPPGSDEHFKATGIVEHAQAGEELPTIKDLTKDFLLYWQVQWSRFIEDDLWMSRYQQRMIQPGHVLIAADGRKASIKSLASDGALAIWDGGKETTLHSAAESWRWHLQVSDRFVVADIGNTAVKLGVASVRSTGVEVRQAVPFLVGEPIPEACLPLVKSGTIVYAISVNPQGLKQLETQLCRVGVQVIALSKRRIRTMGNYPLDQLGIDRLAACEAYVQRFPGQAGIVVSCGTAVTVDVLAENGVHLGGWIAPGPQKSLEVMARSTAQLPNLTLENASFALQLGNSSHTAMRQGVRAAMVGLVKEALRFVSPETRIVVTGGYADEIAAALPGCAVEPALLLQGAACLALAGV